MKRLHLALLALFCLAALPSPALACAACFGKSDSPMAYGMNAGILTLLVFIGTMLGLITTFFVFIVRRAARVTADDPAAPTV